MLDIQYTQTRALNSCLISAGQAVPHRLIFSIHLYCWPETPESVDFNFSLSVWSMVDLISVRRRRWSDLGITGDFCCQMKSENSGGLFSWSYVKKFSTDESCAEEASGQWDSIRRYAGHQQGESDADMLSLHSKGAKTLVKSYNILQLQKGCMRLHKTVWLKWIIDG